MDPPGEDGIRPSDDSRSKGKTLKLRVPRPKGSRKIAHRRDSSRKKGRSQNPQNQVAGTDTLNRGNEPREVHAYFKSFDGTRIFYAIEGEGPPLIFCYGLVCSSLHWTYQIEYLRQSYSTVWFDYRGHHNSDTPADMNSLTLENIAKDLGCLMKELKYEKAIFLGHSMGVNIVLEFYKQHPEYFAGMVLANGTARRPLETLFFGTNASMAGFKALRKIHNVSPDIVGKMWNWQRNNPLIHSIVAFGGFNPHLTPKEDIDLYVEHVTSLDPEVLLNLIENYDQLDATPWMHKINVPTLIIGGDQDSMTPLSEQELMQQLIPGSELEVIRHGAHCSQMDLPELVNMKIEKFLEKNGYR